MFTPVKPIALQLSYSWFIWVWDLHLWDVQCCPTLFSPSAGSDWWVLIQPHGVRGHVLVLIQPCGGKRLWAGPDLAMQVGGGMSRPDLALQRKGGVAHLCCPSPPTPCWCSRGGSCLALILLCGGRGMVQSWSDCTGPGNLAGWDRWKYYCHISWSMGSPADQMAWLWDRIGCGLGVKRLWYSEIYHKWDHN